MTVELTFGEFLRCVVVNGINVCHDELFTQESTFSKDSPVVNWLDEMIIELTFEEFYVEWS